MQSSKRIHILFYAQLAGKAEASRVQQLEEQVDEQLNVMCAMRSKQVRDVYRLIS